MIIVTCYIQLENQIKYMKQMFTDNGQQVMYVSESREMVGGGGGK